MTSINETSKQSNNKANSNNTSTTSRKQTSQTSNNHNNSNNANLNATSTIPNKQSWQTSNNNNNKNTKRGRGRPKKYKTKDDFTCKQCKKKFDTYQKLKNCSRKNYNKKCPHCGKILQRRTAYIDHILLHKKMKTHYCRGCNHDPMYMSTKDSHERKCVA